MAVVVVMSSTRMSALQTYSSSLRTTDVKSVVMPKSLPTLYRKPSSICTKEAISSASLKTTLNPTGCLYNRSLASRINSVKWLTVSKKQIHLLSDVCFDLAFKSVSQHSSAISWSFLLRDRFSYACLTSSVVPMFFGMPHESGMKIALFIFHRF